MAEAQYNLGRYEEALSSINAALKGDPKDTDALNIRCSINIKL